MPSPELVAAAGGVGALRRRVAWGALGVVVVGLAVLLATSQGDLLSRVPAPKPPPVLQERARELLIAFRHTERAADDAWSFQLNDDYLRWVRDSAVPGDRWRDLSNARVPALLYWYRKAPRFMRPWSPDTGGRVGFGDPPRIESAMATVVLDGQGRLVSLEVVPPQLDSTAATTAVAIDWQPLFAAAGLDPARFTPAASIWVPAVECDVRAAWTGTAADLADVPLRVEAGAFGGRVNVFSVYGPWSRPVRMAPPEPPRRERVRQAVNAALLFALIFGAAFAARRHLNAGHGDRRGATRLALAILCLNLVAWALVADHSPNVTDEWEMMVPSAGLSLFLAALVWVLYVALEPYVRRQSPDSLISWNRLLAGRGRDPRVGRDVLLGLAAGVVVCLLDTLVRAVAAGVGQPVEPNVVALESLRGVRATLSLLADMHVAAIISPVALLFLVVLVRFLVRRQWIAAGILWVMFSILGASATGPTSLRMAFAAAFVGVQLVVLLRLGLLAGIATNLVLVTLGAYFPLVADPSLWYAPLASVGVLYLVALALYAFWTSLAGQPLAGRRPVAAPELATARR
jgi:serine/threonine-protein kinase